MTVNLIRSEPKSVEVPGRTTAAWLMVVDAVVSASSLTTNNIFVFQKSPDASVIGDRFAAVCSASQLIDMPVDKSKSGNGVFYRGSKAVFLLRTVAEMEQTWVQLLNDVALLVRDWSKLDAGFRSTTTTITPDSVTGAVVSEGGLNSVLDQSGILFKFNADKSRLLLYDSSGTVVAQALLTAPP